MAKLGAHVSAAGGVEHAIDRGEEIGCDTIEIFTKNNRQWQGVPLSAKSVGRFRKRCEQSRITPIFSHASYLINLCSPAESVRVKSRDALIDEVKRADTLRLPFVVLHPGSHGGMGIDYGLTQITEGLKHVIAKTHTSETRIALETMAGQGTILGGSFEHLAQLFERVDAENRLCVCLDSCHVFAAGHDIRTRVGLDKTLETFDQIIGLQRLAAIHLNDSHHGLGERKDRHEHIGQGRIGIEGFRFLINDYRLKHLPMIIETPKGNNIVKNDRKNLKVLRSLVIT